VKSLPPWFRAFVRAVGTLAPPVMATIAFRMFWSLGRPAPVSPAAAAVHARARKEPVRVSGRHVILYRWGTGPRIVLLVHGWRGRGSQFAKLIEALESPERTVVAFDAPGNGDAPGNRTDLRDYLSIIRLVTDTDGTPELMVGHSFGVIGVFVAVREGVRAKRIVSIAGLSDVDYTFRAFDLALGLSPRVDRLLRRKTERDIFDRDTGIWRRFVAELEKTDQTPLLIIHDKDDRTVDPSESAKIAQAHLGPTTELHTSGLGHIRVLSDPAVISAIVRFAGEPARTKSAAE
jgi:pimeloyl-ACP methyl ester carboxylesterase